MAVGWASEGEECAMGHDRNDGSQLGRHGARSGPDCLKRNRGTWSPPVKTVSLRAYSARAAL